MAMILDAFMKKCSTLLVDVAFEEATKVLGVKDEVQKLQRKMKYIQSLLKDAEKRKFNDSSIDLWLSELKDVMYDADDIIDLCKIKGNQLLADDENSKNEIFRVCCNISSIFSSCFTSVPLHHGIGTRIKALNDRLQKIDENRNKFNLQRSEILESPQITLVNPIPTSSLADPLVVGGEVEVAANQLVNLLITDKVEEKCRIFAVAGMGGIGKTTLAQRIFNHPNMQNYFSLKVWICVSQTYSESELLKQVIRKVNGNCWDANTTSELLPILRDSLASAQSLFLVVDDVWRADVWDKLLRVPLQTANTSVVRVLVTTRYEAVSRAMKAAYTHNVKTLSRESSWDMLRKLVFSDGEEQLWDELKELGFDIVERCGGLPLAIKAIAGVLNTRERTKKEWGNILRSDAWSIRDLHEHHIAALHLSFEDLPSHLKQCFLYFSLYDEDVSLFRHQLTRLWVAEGFVTENINEGSLMEDVAKKYLNELLGRNLLLWQDSYSYKMHDLVRSLVIFLSKEETSYGDVNVSSSTAVTKLRRLSIEGKKGAEATEIFDWAAKQGALRTLLASNSELLLNEERLKRISCLRVLDISSTKIKELPDSIGDLVHLRYLDLSFTKITAIPESIEHLSYLQFIRIFECSELTRLPDGITQLCNLRYLNMFDTPIKFMPKGIEKLQQLNYLNGFPRDSNDTGSKLEVLNSLKKLRTLRIANLEGAQFEEIILKQLPHLSDLILNFNDDENDRSEEQKLEAEELIDKIIPPQSLEVLTIENFSGRRLPNWMASTCFENYVPNLTKFVLWETRSIAQLPSLGQLSELRELFIYGLKNLKKIGPEFLGGGVKSTTGIAIAFPKLESLCICLMDELEEWSLGAQFEVNASPRLKILPCLHELIIEYCPALKQLPKGLKHLPIKSLEISDTGSLESLDDLPSELEKLELSRIKHLERVCCPRVLKELSIVNCRALSCMTNLDSLQKLAFKDISMECLPDWLLMLLGQQGLRNKEVFLLKLTCHEKVLQACLKEGCYWELIQQIPRVLVKDERSYLRYNKHPYAYDVNLSNEDY